MKRCPKCECGAEFTNKAEYFAKQAGAFAAAGAVAMGASVIIGPHGKHAGHVALENMRKAITKHYKCTNKNRIMQG